MRKGRTPPFDPPAKGFLCTPSEPEKFVGVGGIEAH
jgi:hypothetical protein